MGKNKISSKDSRKKVSIKKTALPESEKLNQLSQFKDIPEDTYLTSNQGVRINDDQNTLKAGSRGPSLLEDHLFREKIMHFDHERIPERVVHARGSGAHGIFEAYDLGAKYSSAQFLQAGIVTPVFVRFSTVAGFRGSSDMARDVRGFATKFYTQEGIFDLVGNNMPVFFIQDAIKFPDLIHAVKPEPHNEIPQAQSAHDTFWDFISLSTEATHMVMWLMSDRAIPRSLRMMEGFGVHTFRLIDKKGVSRFVKFHWKPLLGVNSVTWDEALKISGKDPDFHRRDLWEAIESGAYPEWELGVQVIEEQDEFSFDFDLLDPTKLVPEELYPVIKIGKMTLNRNPENFFAETEQVAFCISHIVPGIDFTDDPLLQGRLFSYPDTQLKRLGSPNFHEIPINKSIVPIHNNQRDGHMRQTINVGRSSYEPNTAGGGCPFQAGMKMGGFTSFPQAIEGAKLRSRDESFFDHFSQAALFWQSQNDIEKAHIVQAFTFELGKCDEVAIRERMLMVLSHVDKTLANRVADGLGILLPVAVEGPLNQMIPADADEKKYQPRAKNKTIQSSKALSIIDNLKPMIETRKVAILAADGFDEIALKKIIDALKTEGAVVKIISPKGGEITGIKGQVVKVDFILATTSSVLFDAVYVCGGAKSVSVLKQQGPAVLFVAESYKHYKAIGANSEGVEFIEYCLKRGGLMTMLAESDRLSSIMTVKNGIAVDKNGSGKNLPGSFIEIIKQHRCWTRNYADQIVV